MRARRTGISRRSKVDGLRRRLRHVALASCDAGQQILTEYEYLGDTLLVSLERQIDPATDAALETRHGYDAQGRLLSTDGPLPGIDDTIYYRYDVHGRRTWEIGAAGAGGVQDRDPHQLSRCPTTRSSTRDRHDPRSEQRRASTPLRRTDFAYDARRNPVRETVSGCDAATQSWIATTLAPAQLRRPRPARSARRGG